MSLYRFWVLILACFLASSSTINNVVAKSVENQSQIASKDSDKPIASRDVVANLEKPVASKDNDSGLKDKKNNSNEWLTASFSKKQINKLKKAKTKESTDPDAEPAKSDTEPAEGEGWKFDGTTLTVYGPIKVSTIQEQWHTITIGEPIENGLFRITIEALINPQKVVFTSDAKIPLNWSYMYASFTNLTEIEGFEKFEDMNPIALSYMFYQCDKLKNIDVSHFKTDNAISMIGMFGGCDNVTELDVSKFVTDKLVHMENMFKDCSKLTNLNLKNFNTSNAITMDGMFWNCSNLTKIDIDPTKFDTSNVRTMKNMFNGCTSLTDLDINSFNTSNVTDMSFMFYGCSQLPNLDVSKFDTSKVTNMKSMFNTCSSLPSLDISNFYTPEVTDMSFMFYNCSSLTSLDISNFYTPEVTDMNHMFYECSKLESLDVSKFDTSKVTNMQSMFYNCSSLPSLDISNFYTPEVTDMSFMFYECSQLPSLNVSKFDTRKVTNMTTMFYNCSSLPSLDISNFYTPEVTDMSFMFYGCSKLPSLDASKFDTNKVTNMQSMFYNCSNLTSLDISNFYTPEVTDMSFMFHECSKLQSLNVSNFDTSKVTNMRSMFSTCSSLQALDVSSFDTPEVTDMSYMFYGCSQLPSLDVSNFDTSKVTNMFATFYNCSSLTSLDTSNFDTPNVTDMSYMFRGCSQLPSLDVSKFDTSKVTSMNYMFYSCSSLTSLDISNFNTTLKPTMTGILGATSNLSKLTLGKNTLLADDTDIPAAKNNTQYPQVHPHKGLWTTGKWQEYLVGMDTDQWTASGQVLNPKDIINRHKAINTTNHTYVWQAKNYYQTQKSLKTINANGTAPVGNNAISTTYTLTKSSPIDQFKLEQTGTNSNNMQVKDGSTISITYGTTTTNKVPFNYNQVYTAADFGIAGNIPANSTINISQPITVDLKYVGIESNKLVLAADKLLSSNFGENEWQEIAKTTQAIYNIELSSVNLSVPTKIDFGTLYILDGILNPQTVDGELSLYNPESFAQNIRLTYSATSSTPLIAQNLKYNHPKYGTDGRVFGFDAQEQTVNPNKKIIIPTKQTSIDKRGVTLDFTKNNMLPFGNHEAEIKWEVTNSI